MIIFNAREISPILELQVTKRKPTTKSNTNQIQCLSDNRHQKYFPLLIEIFKCSSAIWTHSRRLRDNGQVTKEQLTWKVDPKIKRNFYGEKDNALIGSSKISNTSETNSEKPDFSKVLNYQRRKWTNNRINIHYHLLYLYLLTFLHSHFSIYYFA